MLGLIARVPDVVEEGSGWHTDTETVSAAFTGRGLGLIRCKGCCASSTTRPIAHPT